MLNVVLDDCVIKGLTDKLGVIFYASKVYPSSSLFGNIFYLSLYVSLIGEKVIRNEPGNSELVTLQLCSPIRFISCCQSKSHVGYFLLCPS